MSLVSCIMGMTQSLNTTSDLEYSLNEIMQEQQYWAKTASELGEALAGVDTKISTVESYIDLAKSRQAGIMYGGRQQNPDDWNSLEGRIAEYLEDRRILQQVKRKIKGKERAAHEESKKMDLRKNRIETQKKLAEQNLQGFEKMRDAAIQRSAIKG